MVGVAQFGRAPDCDSGRRGFKSHRPPQMHIEAVSGLWFTVSKELGPLAQLVEQLTLNQRVVGSKPTRPTTEILNLQLNIAKQPSCL